MTTVVKNSEIGIASQIPITPNNCGIIKNTGIRKIKPHLIIISEQVSSEYLSYEKNKKSLT